MALYAFDGTGNQDEEREEKDSNVVDFFNAYLDPEKNDDPDEERGSLYLKGIGQRARTFLGRGPAEIFGIGGHRRVRQAMARLENNMEAGDDTIDIVGFSRGAALAMSFANNIDKEMPDAKIRFVGVFDLVAQFGLPGRHLNAGHIVTLPDNVENCFHAMARDESRGFFPLTRLCKEDGSHPKVLAEVWFRGVHSDIGGGNENRGLNWIALNWMFAHAKRLNLPIDPAAIAKNLADQSLPRRISAHKADLEIERRCFNTDRLHFTVRLGPSTDGTNFIDPPFPLQFVDDEGNIVEPQLS
jgi:uncharacterized protein (DUF2235 family)